jgi:hypothetical protein
MFKITKQTTFSDLEKEACNFWGLDSTVYRMNDQSMNELLAISGGSGNASATVEGYFRH